MPITAEDAAKQVYEAIKAQGKFNIGNALDAAIGVASTNAPDLQAFLNDLLTKKGVLSSQDEAALKQLLADQEAEKKKRQAIRVRNGIVFGVVAAVVGATIFFLLKNKPKS